MSDYKFLSKGPSQWGEAFQSLWGYHNICPSLNQFHVASIIHLELSSLTSLKAWGDAERFCSDIAFLLDLTKEGAVGDRVYSLSMIWVNPYQARVSTVEEAVKQLTALVSTRPDWSYPLVWLNRDAHHVPLPREGHLSILMEGSTSSATCRRVSQLEVCQLLSSGSQVTYLAGLNGCEVPVIASTPESLAKGTNLLGGEPIYLKVDIPQSIVGAKTQSAALWQSLLFHPDCTSHQGSPANGRRRGQHDHGGERAPIPGRIRHIWTHIRNSTAKRLQPMVLVSSLPTKPEDFPWSVDTSSQVSALDDAEMKDATLEEIPAASSPTAETPGPSSGAPPSDAALLWEEANKALGELLVIVSSTEAHWQKLVR